MEVIVTIRKSDWIPSRPWTADLEMDGHVFRSWIANYKTRKALLAEVMAVAPKAEIRYEKT